MPAPISTSFEIKGTAAFPPNLGLRISTFKRTLTRIKTAIFGADSSVFVGHGTIFLAVGDLAFFGAVFFGKFVAEEEEVEGGHHALGSAVVELGEALGEAGAAEGGVFLALAGSEAFFDFFPAGG